jgi:hypothetical protein
MNPFFQILLSYVNNDPVIITKWIKMFFRYYQNWIYENYDYSGKRVIRTNSSKKLRKVEMKFLRYMGILETILRSLSKKKKLLTIIVIPLSKSLNTIMRKALPVVEPIYLIILRLLNPILNRFSRNILKFVKYANPIIFQNQKRGF